MAALTYWDMLLNDPTAKTVTAPYEGSFGYYRNLQNVKNAEAARLQHEADLRAQAAAEFAAAGTSEERSKTFLANMYHGGTPEEDRRVLTQDEIKNGWVDSTGAYHSGRQSFADYGMASEDSQATRHRQASHDWYTSGMDLFEGPYAITNEWDLSDNASVYGNPDWMQRATDHVNGIAGRNTISPWVDTFQHDRIGTYNLVRDSDYNAFLGSEGARQSGIDGYTDDSIAGYFKNAFAGQDQVGNRTDAIRSLRQWNEGGAGDGLNKATDVMTKQYFDQLDLANKYGLTWEQAGAVIDSNGGTATGGSNDLASGNGMLSHQKSSWMDVLNRGTASLENWDSLLGQYTYDSPLNWAGMSDQEVENSFGNLFDNGGMFTQGKNRDLIYATLMENLGRV